MSHNSTFSSILDSIDTDTWIWKIGAFCFPMFGIPGHLILLIITALNSNRKRSHPTCLYFIFISITELIFLMFLFWDWLDIVNLAPDPRQILNCGMFYPFVSGTGFISLVLLAQLNIDRMFIIHQPQYIHFYLTQKRILIKIILTYSSLFIFIFHYCFSLYYDPNKFIIFGQSCQVHSYARQWFFSIWPYVYIVTRLTPCFIIIFCTTYIFHNRCYRNYDRKTWFHRQQRTFYLVLIIYSIYTLLSIIPICIVQIFNHSMWKYELRCYRDHCLETDHQVKRWKLINTICIMCEASIYTMKFYIKLFFSIEFRNDMKKLIFFRSTN